MILVLAATWLRFFCYFLVVRAISKLLLTLVAMLLDTLGFILLAMCYLLIISTVFTTLFQDINPDSFSNLAITARTLYDAILATYDYSGITEKQLLYSVLLISHVLFSHVILLNYLIAILTLTYEKMQQTGIFQYKCNLFQYCERYMASFQDECYGQLIVYPAPLNYFLIAILPFMCCGKKTARKANRCFRVFMFWLENFALVLVLFLGELLLCPIAFVKIL